MAVQNVVTPTNLGVEFDLGVEVANKISVKVDGTSIIKTAGVLSAAPAALRVVMMALGGGSAQGTGGALGETANTAQLVDLADKNFVRFQVGTVTAASGSGEVTVRYGTTVSGPHATPITVGPEPIIMGSDIGADKFFATPWLPLDPAAKASVYVAFFVRALGSSLLTNRIQVEFK